MGPYLNQELWYNFVTCFYQGIFFWKINILDKFLQKFKLNVPTFSHLSNYENQGFKYKQSGIKWAGPQDSLVSG